MDREELLKQISALDFMAVDLQLYLDTHPCDQQALWRYNNAVLQSQWLKCKYESMCGPLTSFRSTSAYPWQWINNPWPWSAQFNFRIQQEGNRNVGV